MTFDNTQPHPSDALSLTELTLYHQIMEYRGTEGLDPIPLSLGLTTTAGRHAADTLFNIYEPGLTLPDGTNLHSWSDAPYFRDHSQPEVMWEAPQRIGTSYPGSGFEISALGYADTAAALEGWKGSPGHNTVIVNEGIWASQTWNAIGVGIELHSTLGRIYHVWFGRDSDPEDAPRIFGTGSLDQIDGTAFDDWISGGKGNDDISGGAGRDMLRGGGGRDVISGNAGRDQLLGMGGADELSGGGGKDRLVGGAGNDILTGGGHSDLLIFKGANFGSDTVVGYEGDRIRITANGEASTRAELAASLSDQGGNAVYDHLNDGKNMITLEGVSVTELDLSLFDLG